MDEAERERILGESRAHLRWCAEARAEWAAREADPADPIAEADRLQAEYRRERRPTMRSDDPGDIICKRRENSAPAPAPAGNETDWSGWEAWLAAHLRVEREQLIAAIGEALGTKAVQLRTDYGRKIADQEREIGELQRQVDRLEGMLLALTSKGSAEIVPLPPRKVG